MMNLRSIPEDQNLSFMSISIPGDEHESNRLYRIWRILMITICLGAITSPLLYIEPWFGFVDILIIATIAIIDRQRIE